MAPPESLLSKNLEQHTNSFPLFPMMFSDRTPASDHRFAFYTCPTTRPAEHLLQETARLSAVDQSDHPIEVVTPGSTHRWPHYQSYLAKAAARVTLDPRTMLHVRYGDIVTESDRPVLCKTRPIRDWSQGGSANVLFPFNRSHHDGVLSVLPELDMPWAEKDSKLVWRGSTTGKHYNRTRFALVDALAEYPLADVGFSQIVQGERVSPWDLKPPLSIQKHLRSRFILAPEGNDVATNLKWVLASNSVPLMPHPTMVSWFLEHLLVPFEHYVPLARDASDVMTQHQWCLDHPDECRRIAENGKRFMETFQDPETERLLEQRVLRHVVGPDASRPEPLGFFPGGPVRE